MSYRYKYPRAALTADIMIFREKEANTQLLLIKRKFDPFKGMWALPGGFMEMDETLVQAAKRELREETGLICEDLSFLHTFDKLDRDPRGRTISTVFYGFLKESSAVMAGDDASQAEWFPHDDLPELAFDHEEIIDFGFKNIADLKR